MKNRRVRYLIPLLAALVLFLGLIPSALAQGGQVSGMVWLDKEVDGLFNNERGLANTIVKLVKVLDDGTEEELMAAKTGKDGLYAFSIPENGNYVLTYSLPNDYRFTMHGKGSCALPARGTASRSLPFTLTDGQVLTMNAGAVSGNSYLSVIAFEDLNLNGGRRDSEPRVRKVTVELYYQYEGKSYFIASAETNKDGETSISRLSPGQYYVKAILPENFVAGPLGTKLSTFYNCMQPSIDNICYTAPFEIPNRANAGIGIGCVTTGTLKGSIWQDDNGNQLRDANEGGCVNAKVTVSSADLNISREGTVESDGSYTFTGLQPAQYDLTFELPEGMIFASGADSQLNNIASTASMPVLVQAEETVTAAPVGATMASRVEISIADVSEDEPAPLANVQGQFVQYGEAVCEAVSDENGLLVFPIARSGEGTVNITLPQGYVVAMEGGAFPYVNGQTAPSFALSVPLNDTAFASGNAIRSASVSGRLVEDPTNTGIVTESSTPLPGFTVQAIDTEGQVVLESITDENGAYTLSPLVPETYYVRFLLDDRYIATPCLSDESSEHNAIYIQEPLFGETDAVVLYPGQQKVSVNGALFRASSVEGSVLLNPDLNELATNAGGAKGITVTLLDENGNVWQDYAYDISDENGAFCIKGILPGTYSLQYELPAAHAFVAPAAEGTYLISNSFTIENGSQIQQPPVGVVQTASVSGRVLDYTTEDGVNASLSLMPLDGGDTITVSSAADGAYAFEGLLPGDYMLTVTLKGGYLFADSPDSILPYLNDNASGTVISLPMGVVEEDWNVVASQPVDWNITLFHDANENGNMDADETAAPGRTLHLSLRNDLIGTYVSDDNGVVHLTGIIPAQYTATVGLADREYFSMNPNENTAVINADGLAIALHQPSEITGRVWSLDGTQNGIASIRIILIKDSVEVSYTTTDENGSFTFDKLHRGDYQLRAELPEGYLFARIQDGQTRASYILSQTDGSLLFGVIPLQYGQQFTGADIGIGGMGSIGDTAWLDENKNGMQDIGEPCLPGIQIELYQHGILVASAETDVYGRYALTGLYPGSYEMKVTMPKEIKPTIRQTEFPLVASILPESSETTVTVEEVIVPSMGRNLNMDLGFVLKKKNVYPDSMKDIPEKDWTPYGRTEED